MGQLTNASRLIDVQDLQYFEGKLANKYQGKAISLEGITATTVEGALSELKGSVSGSDITWEVLATPNEGKSKTIRLTKGTGQTATTLDIDFEKEQVRAVVGFVTITEGTGANAGKYYDGATEVGSADGVTGAGVYLKSQELADGVATGVVKYVDASAVIEYLTVGAQTGAAVVLSIDATTHQISASISDGTIAKGKLDSSVQASLGLADTALQSHQDISGKADTVSGGTENNFVALDASGNIKDSGHKHSDYKTQQSAVSDPTAGSATDTIEFIATASQNANGEISVTKQSVRAASATQSGVMSSAHYSKLESIAYATNDDIDEIFA